jgi:hypothetical protein
VCGKALELIAGYRSFPPVGPIRSLPLISVPVLPEVRFSVSSRHKRSPYVVSCLVLEVQSGRGAITHKLQEEYDVGSMENVHERIEALEQQMRALGAHTRTVERRRRWWRGVACGLGLLGLVSLSLQSGTAADPQPRGMPERMAVLERKLSAIKFDEAANEVVITGANLRIVNGLGTTNTTNGVGNLIVGFPQFWSKKQRSVVTICHCMD